MTMMGGGGGPREVIPGVTDIFTLMAFLGDTKGIKKYLKELVEKTTELRKERELVGSARKINDLLAQTEQERVAGDAIVKKSREDAEKIVLNAANEAAATKLLTDKKSKSLKKRENLLEDAEKAFSDKQSEFAEKSTQIAAQLGEVTRKEAALDKELREIEATRAAMKRLVA